MLCYGLKLQSSSGENGIVYSLYLRLYGSVWAWQWGIALPPSLLTLQQQARKVQAVAFTAPVSCCNSIIELPLLFSPCGTNVLFFCLSLFVVSLARTVSLLCETITFVSLALLTVWTAACDLLFSTGARVSCGLLYNYEIMLTFHNDELNCLCYFMIRETGILADMCNTSDWKAENNIQFILGFSSS